jgi:hypothetical protein
MMPQKILIQALNELPGHRFINPIEMNLEFIGNASRMDPPASCELV